MFNLQVYQNILNISESFPTEKFVENILADYSNKTNESFVGVMS